MWGESRRWPVPSFDPGANDTRYSLDYAVHLVCRERPTSVHVAGDHPGVTEAVVRRLPRDVAVSASTPEVAGAVAVRLRRSVTTGSGRGADALIVPFAGAGREPGSLPDVAALEVPLIVAVEHNACSYKSLLTPGRLTKTAGDVERWIGRRSRIIARVGVMGPDFIALWGLALLAGECRPDWHFRLRDLAMQRIYSKGPLWRYGYVVVLAGRRA